MVFHCRCFSLFEHDKEIEQDIEIEQEEAIEYETRTQAKSTTTFYTAASDFNSSVPNSDAKPPEVSTLADKPFILPTLEEGTAGSDLIQAVPNSKSKLSKILSLDDKTSNMRVFTVAELETATGNFSTVLNMGEGRFGTLYKGVIKSLEHPFHDIQVAVKIPIIVLQGQKEWEIVTNVLGVVDHPNLVNLIGYCDNELLLVHEYMVNGSLRDHLSSRTQTPLSWIMRLSVALDIANAFTYLHEQMDSQIIVGDFNPSYVLLDDQWSAKLSDFGWAELRPQEWRGHLWTTFTGPGTEGYVAPEGPRTSMSDVWSYGVFLYELITGRRSWETHRPANEQGQKEWETEINVLGVVDHPNLVKLIGYCVDDNELLLVHEYMVNGRLRDHLSSRTQTPLSWTMRLNVAQDIASAFTYLHEQIDSQIIAGDFNPSNVLLDDQWNAKLSDFGWAELRPQERRGHVWTTFRGLGTEGYVVLERPRTSMSDVWSYGVFLYELITGRRPIDRNRPANEQVLLKWVKPYLESKRLRHIVDPRLKDDYPLETVEKLSIIAEKCVSLNPKSRPKMSEVLEIVNQLIMVPSQATSLASPLVPQVAVDPNKAFVGPNQDEKIKEDSRHEGQNGSMKIQLKKPACLPRIRPLKILKSCLKKGCCVHCIKINQSLES